MKGILLTDDNELQVLNGTLILGDIRAQAAQHIITANAGDYKEKPLIGVGITKMLNGGSDPSLINRIKTQLKSAKINIEKLQINNNIVEIDL